MARMIDADRLLRELTALSHGQVWPGWTYDGIRLLIERQPTLTPPNEPLTLEELREMNEMPIYVVTEAYGSGWCILNWHGVNKSYTYFSRTGTAEGMTATPLSAKTYGDLWTAYRRPPEGEKET